MEGMLDRILELEENVGDLHLRQDEDGKTYIRIYGEGRSYCLDIIFYNAVLQGEFSPEKPAISFCVNREEGMPYLTFKQKDWEGPGEVEISLFFDDIKEVVVPCNYIRNTCCWVLGFNPWNAILEYVCGVQDKIEDCGEKWANEKEKRLAELVSFRPLIQCIWIDGEEEQKKAAKRFLSYIQAVKKDENSVLIQLENAVSRYMGATDEKERHILEEKIEKLMLKKETRPLFMHIFEEFQECVSDYIPFSEVEFERKEIEPVRKEIHEAMLSEGFTGEYPYYYKPGEIKGFHRVNRSHGRLAVWNAKEVGLYLKVIEEVYPVGDDENERQMLHIIFEGARVILRKKRADEVAERHIEMAYYEPGDLAIAKHWEVVETQQSSKDEEYVPFSARKHIELVVKALECKRIEKEEKEEVVLHEVTNTSRGAAMLIYTVWGLLLIAVIYVVMGILY